MYIFDIRINTWSTKQTKSSAQQYPCDREDDSFAFSTNTCYLSGGEDDVEFYTDIWKIDFESIEWCKLDYSLCLHTTSVVEDKYLYRYNADQDDSNDPYFLERFILRPPTLYRPSLEKICRSPNMRHWISSLPPVVAYYLNFDNNYLFFDV
ncbi:hypothetical protein RF11_09139 [Thelohanellus kitauei]|uniref:Kelch domain-containing protein 10 n=1 Tax=Thelohanellus kitauei TaxID=669202 RepID=A0A0C2N4V4_THEKT|nr:hypothetical protein RF11_09139 [Thelohanellus kitauei]